MNIAGLRVRITIQKNTTAVDRIGNHTSVWTDFFSCFINQSGIKPFLILNQFIIIYTKNHNGI